MTTQTQSQLTNDELQNLTAKFEEHIQYRNGKIVDTHNDIELDVEVDENYVKVLTHDHEDQFRVNRETLQSAKTGKQRKLFQKTQQLITKSITNRRFNEQVESEKQILSEKFNTQKYKQKVGNAELAKVEMNEDQASYTVEYKNGAQFLVDRNEGKLEVVSMTKPMEDVIEVEATSESE